MNLQAIAARRSARHSIEGPRSRLELDSALETGCTSQLHCVSKNLSTTQNSNMQVRPVPLARVFKYTYRENKLKCLLVLSLESNLAPLSHPVPHLRQQEGMITPLPYLLQVRQPAHQPTATLIMLLSAKSLIVVLLMTWFMLGRK